MSGENESDHGFKSFEPGSRDIDGLSPDIAKIWREARDSYSAGRKHVSLLMCRKLFMRMAWDKVGTERLDPFAISIDDLLSSGEIPNSHQNSFDLILRACDYSAGEPDSLKDSEMRNILAVTEQCLRNLYAMPNQIVDVKRFETNVQCGRPSP